uniref:Uncharacterized protein n=1 Tax=Myotis myotis TaxID=51298 RepID=A0A7J7Z5X3_MYOMY|nr:hypothetical protein mMyoMyo1_010505 [Myotis myotis]
MTHTDHQGPDAQCRSCRVAVTWQWQFSGDAPKNQRGGSPIPRGPRHSTFGRGLCCCWGTVSPKSGYCTLACAFHTLQDSSFAECPLTLQDPWGMLESRFQPNPRGSGRGTPPAGGTLLIPQMPRFYHSCPFCQPFLGKYFPIFFVCVCWVLFCFLT